ncbi:MerR family transcriptional regulator [Paenibacillus sp. GCM10027626]|uniref:MerR family transcriptional regulator n=1 Tax=Paenibacillus sp. GCM10027626 TaxID=3273411 RepID=UPI00362E7DB4
MYSIGQLSKKTGVTVRTLDYYDEVGLVVPSSATDGGHRLYSEHDVLRLEQVLALKYMGFSLQQIKKILEESTVTWQQSINRQLEMVKQQQIRLQALEKALEGVLHSIEFEGEVKWPVIFETIRLFQHDPQCASHMFEKYFSNEEVKDILHLNNQLTKDDLRKWLAVIRDIQAHLHEDPGSDIAQSLTGRWLEQVQDMFGSDESRLDKMWEAVKDRQNGIAFYPLDEEMIHFIERALTIMYAKRDRRGEEQ